MLKKSTSRPSTFFFILIGLIVAAVLRFWRLDSLPPGLYHDEAYNGLDALSLIQGKRFPQFYEGWELYAQDVYADRQPEATRFPLFFEGNYGREPLHIYLMALAITFLRATPFAIRIVPATAGVLAILTTYLAGKALLEAGDLEAAVSGSLKNPRARPATANYAPVIAAFVLAALYPAVHFSRFGIRPMLFLPIETMCVLAFWRAIAADRREPSSVRSRFWFAVSGCFLGLGLYTYAVARLFPLLFVVFIFLWFWRDRVAFRRLWGRIVFMAGVSLLVAAPLILFFVRTPYYFVFRIAYVANKGAGTVEGKPALTWLLNIGRVAGSLIWRGETHLRHNLPGRPFLDAIQAALFAIGSGLSLRRLRRPEYTFLILWTLIMLLPSVLSGDAPHFGRMSGAAPPIAILAGVGADWLRQRIAGWAIETGGGSVRIAGIGARYAGMGLVTLLLLISTAWTINDYFSSYAQHPDVPVDFYLPDWQLGQYAAAQPEETNLYLTPTQAEMATIYFALADPERLQSYNGAAGLIPAGRAGTPTLYLVRPYDGDSLESLSRYFPDGFTGRERVNFVPFLVPADAPRVRLENVAEYDWDGKISLLGWTQAREDHQVAVTLAWQAQAEVEKNYTAFVHVLNENGELVAQSDHPPAGYPTTDWRPGEIVVDRFTLSLPHELSDTRHQLETGWYYLPTLQGLGAAASLGGVLPGE